MINNRKRISIVNFSQIDFFVFFFFFRAATTSNRAPIIGINTIKFEYTSKSSGYYNNNRLVLSDTMFYTKSKRIQIWREEHTILWLITIESYCVTILLRRSRFGFGFGFIYSFYRLFNLCLFFSLLRVFLSKNSFIDHGQFYGSNRTDDIVGIVTKYGFSQYSNEWRRGR